MAIEGTVDVYVVLSRMFFFTVLSAAEPYLVFFCLCVVWIYTYAGYDEKDGTVCYSAITYVRGHEARDRVE